MVVLPYSEFLDVHVGETLCLEDSKPLCGCAKITYRGSETGDLMPGLHGPKTLNEAIVRRYRIKT